MTTINLPDLVIWAVDRFRGEKSRDEWVSRAILTIQNEQNQEEKGPRLLVNMSAEDVAAVRDLARKCKTSPSALALVAIKQMLVAAEAGALPMIAPSTLDKAYTLNSAGDLFGPPPLP